jgi:hypothetical protein
LEATFAAIATLKARTPQLYERLRFVFIGTSNQPVDAAAEVVMPFARRAGIADIVKEEPRRVAYLDALNILMRADALLMLGSDEPHYTPSKLYPVLLAKRPALGVFHEESSACPIAEAVGGIKLIKFARGRSLTSQIPEIATAIQLIAEKPQATGCGNLSSLEPYMGPAVARCFAGVFQQVLERAMP